MVVPTDRKASGNTHVWQAGGQAGRSRRAETRDEVQVEDRSQICDSQQTGELWVADDLTLSQWRSGV